MTDQLTHQINDALDDLTAYGWDGGFTLKEFIADYELGEYSRTLAFRLGRELREIGWHPYITTRNGKSAYVWRENDG